VQVEEIYKKDLEKHPNNPWSLRGLIVCLERRNGEGLDEVRVRLNVQRLSKFADFDVKASCGCVGMNKKKLCCLK